MEKSKPREWNLFSSYSTEHDAMKWYVTRDSEITPEVETPERVKVIELQAFQKCLEIIRLQTAELKNTGCEYRRRGVAAKCREDYDLKCTNCKTTAATEKLLAEIGCGDE